MSPVLEDALDPALAARLEPHLEPALRENGLDASYRGELLALAATPRDRWPACCGGLCDPCTLALQRSLARALRLAGEA